MLAWDDRGMGLWQGKADGIHAQVCNWSGRPGYGLIMWGDAVPERDWDQRYPSAKEAMRAGDELVEGWLASGE